MNSLACMRVYARVYLDGVNASVVGGGRRGWKSFASVFVCVTVCVRVCVRA